MKIDFIVNIGVCGKKDSDVGDGFFQVYRIKNASNKKEEICPVYIQYSEMHSILSSEKIVINKREMQGEDYVDMESYGVDFVCTKEKIPYVLLKKPFDIVGNESKKVDISELQRSLTSLDTLYLFQEITQFFERYEKKHIDQIDLSYYKNYFRFTFSEFEIFKKQYNKLNAYKLDFESFFEKNKNLQKKEFLKKLETV